MTSTTLTIFLTVAGADGQPRQPLEIATDTTAAALREQVSAVTRIPLKDLKLIFRGRLIGDDSTKLVVTEFKLESDCVVHCLGKPTTMASSSTAVPGTIRGTTTATATRTGNETNAASIPSHAGLRIGVPTGAGPARPTVSHSADPLQGALQALRSTLSIEDYVTAITTLDKIISNIVNHPLEEKYRKVKKQNAAFQKRLGGKSGGEAAMFAAGFVIQTDDTDGEDYYVLEAHPEAWPKLLATRSAVETALRQAQTNSTTTAISTSGITVGPRPITNPFLANSNFPGVQNEVAELLADPSRFQAMMQNPMVQGMMQNNPQFARAAQMMDNPHLMEQLAQRMRDPAVQSMLQEIEHNPQIMEHFVQQIQGSTAGTTGGSSLARPAGMPGIGGNMGAANRGVTQRQPPQQQHRNSTLPTSGTSDEQMTEEEMIAEAIRRSLQDG